jgi:hypothetical protein
MMARKCTVCTHPRRYEIDEALVSGQPCAVLSARYGTIGRMALQRHRAEHLPVALVRAQGAKETVTGESLLAKAVSLGEEARQIGKLARKRGDLRTALNAIREQTRIVGLLAEMNGELQEQSAGVTGSAMPGFAEFMKSFDLTRPQTLTLKE